MNPAVFSRTRFSHTRLAKAAAAASAAAVLSVGMSSAAVATAAPPTGSLGSLGSLVSDTQTAPVRTQSESQLYTAMRSLWEQHMEWTYALIATFHDSASSDPAGLSDEDAADPEVADTLGRLLQNQVDIGDAVKPYYGDDAGDQLTALLKKHILAFAPILTSIKNGQDPAKADLDHVYANAVKIGDFLAAANPDNWDRQDMEDMMTVHIDQTLDYGGKQMAGDVADSIASYNSAEAHMMDMSDMLSSGIIAQFPDQFTG